MKWADDLMGEWISGWVIDRQKDEWLGRWVR